MSSMDFLLEKDFFQHADPDGTARSVCLNCFQTVASTSDREELALAEAQHFCPRKKKAPQLDRFSTFA
jgi:hypothetical protein